MNYDLKHWDKVRRLLKRRLQKLELQAADHGSAIDPAITIEIADLGREIRALESNMEHYLRERFEAREAHRSRIRSSLTESRSAHGSVELDLSGKWLLHEAYEFGQSTGRVELHQNGCLLSGCISIHDTMDDGEVIIIEQDFLGTLRRRTVFLYGTEIRGIGGRVDHYELDQWIGTIENEAVITGYSEDLEGTTGTFTMRRVSSFGDPATIGQQAMGESTSPHSVSTVSNQIYPMAAIRDLLLASFTVAEITRFCHDYSAFRPIYDSFSPNDGLDARVDRVIRYCETRDLFDELLVEVKAMNPRQYARFADTLAL